MKTLYIECNMGAAGDMIMAALLEIAGEKDKFIDEINSLGLSGVHAHYIESVKCGIMGTHIDIHVHGHEEESHDENASLRKFRRNGSSHEHNGYEHIHDHDAHNHEHNHCDYKSISDIINSLPVSNKVKKDAEEIYKIIAEAESKVHGKSVSEIHFHEVGNMDAIADIVGACMLFELLAPEKIITSPICTGSGSARCSHGIIPVPAPATALILQGVPSYSGNIKSELCTPTGAAILKYFTDEFAMMPVMTTKKIGYGMGKKDFEKANCVRMFLGETICENDNTNDEIAELSCNLDDMTGEAIGYASEILFEHGALDVYYTPIYMKKNRPAVLLSCLCPACLSDKVAALILKHTTTFGVRKTIHKRYILERSFEKISTEYGDIAVKKGTGYGVSKIKAEFSDVVRAAADNNVTIETIIRKIK